MCIFGIGFLLFFFKQKTAYEMRISDWSSDVCSSDRFESSRARHSEALKARAFGASPCSGHGFAARRAADRVAGIGRGSGLMASRRYRKRKSGWNRPPPNLARNRCLRSSLFQSCQNERVLATEDAHDLDACSLCPIVEGMNAVEDAAVAGAEVMAPRVKRRRFRYRIQPDRKSTRLNNRHHCETRMPSSAV